MGRGNMRNSAANQEKFVAGSRHHIGTDEWTWAPFWWPLSLLEYYENAQLICYLNINDHSSMERPDNIGQPTI